MQQHTSYLQSVADTVLDAGGPTRGMTEAMEAFDGDAGELCPKDLTILAHSGRPVVTSDGDTVYNRPPEVPRLSDRELNELRGRVRGYTNRPGSR